MKKILFAIALAIVATACNHKESDHTAQVGKIAIEAATRGEVENNISSADNKFVLDGELVPAANDLKVEIVGNNETRTWETLAAFNAENENLTFASAPYTITLSYGEKGVEGWSKPYFEGATTVEVPMYGLTATANIQVAVTNSIVAVETTDNFNGYFPESSFKINGIEWDSTKAESLFMNSGEVTISCEATRQTGTKTELSTKVTLKPATRHTVKFDLSTAGNANIHITFDDELEEVVELEFEMNDNA